jgi:hypothetical protein
MVINISRIRKFPQMGPYTRIYLIPVPSSKSIVNGDPNHDADDKRLQEQRNVGHHLKRFKTSENMDLTRLNTPQSITISSVSGSITTMNHSHAPIRLVIQLTGSVRNQYRQRKGLRISPSSTSLTRIEEKDFIVFLFKEFLLFTQSNRVRQVDLLLAGRVDHGLVVDSLFGERVTVELPALG